VFWGELAVIHLKSRWDQDLLFLGLVVKIMPYDEDHEGDESKQSDD
jgi:hypothetical protein